MLASLTQTSGGGVGSLEEESKTPGSGDVSFMDQEKILTLDTLYTRTSFLYRSNNLEPFSSHASTNNNN